jgi:hypothetical protein
MSANNPQNWLDIAEEDLASAQKLAAPPSPHWKTAVYHCQQAAEKAVKALLVQHDGMLSISAVCAKTPPFKWGMERHGRFSGSMPESLRLFRPLSARAARHRNFCCNRFFVVILLCNKPYFVI